MKLASSEPTGLQFFTPLTLIDGDAVLRQEGGKLVLKTHLPYQMVQMLLRSHCSQSEFAPIAASFLESAEDGSTSRCLLSTPLFSQMVERPELWPSML